MPGLYGNLIGSIFEETSKYLIQRTSDGQKYNCLHKQYKSYKLCCLNWLEAVSVLPYSVGFVLFIDLHEMFKLCWIITRNTRLILQSLL